MSEAANPDGADARSPEAELRALAIADQAFDQRRTPRTHESLREIALEQIREAELVAESRGAKARDARIEALEGALRGEIWNAVNRRRQNLLAIGLPIHPAAKQMLDEVEVFVQASIQRVLPLGTDAERPSGSPSVPAARPPDPYAVTQPMEPFQGAAAQGSYSEPDRLLRAAMPMIDRAMRDNAPSPGGDPQSGEETLRAAKEGALWLRIHGYLRAPTPALPREAPEPGGSPAGTPERVLFMQAKSWPGEGGDVYSESRCAFCARPVAADAVRLRLARTNDGEWWVIPERPVAPDEQQFGHFILPIGPDCLGRHPEFRVGLVGAEPPPLTECDLCDGCGWYEGGPTIKTTCTRCGGSGSVPAPQAPSSPESPAVAADAGDRK